MKNMWIYHEKFHWIFMGFNFIVVPPRYILDTVEAADVYEMQIDHKCRMSSEARWSQLNLGRLVLSATGRYQKGPCKKIKTRRLL